ncbi:MaoC family dehydratase N-terminal domain-containing protein [Paenibacillus segetis]|uniref:N-terminal of MaoC-like dehydratase domain-containing protein n=1 Tax=Paenibacillus segetis TaxID=1325360 RepID=A0ABQ1YCH6_9BACL|nr:MaoC family dehydratase N-terminal domain-containing protein [Paenibacillus segetis]GGH21057.1 hypothetical protein GCM10008013_18760 [Paenibacillus segetis]
MNIIQHQIHITAEWITDYAQSIDAPLQVLQGKLVAPSTMPIIFWQAFDIPWLKGDHPLIHGKQHFSYEAPITARMILDCELSLTQIENKTSRHGNLILYTHSLVCFNEGDLIVTAETVLISVGENI